MGRLDLYKKDKKEKKEDKKTNTKTTSPRTKLKEHLAKDNKSSISFSDILKRMFKHSDKTSSNIARLGKLPKGKAQKALEKLLKEGEQRKEYRSAKTSSKKDKAIMKAEKASRKRAKDKMKDAAIMKAEKARRKKAKSDIPTGRSAAASGYTKRKESGKRRGYKKGASGPSGRK